MTSDELKALQDLNLADNNIRAITAEKLREVISQLLAAKTSMLDLPNSNLTQALPSDTWSELSLDQDLTSTTDAAPYYLTNIQRSQFMSGNRIRLEGLPTYSRLSLRFDITCEPTSNNDFVDFRIVLRDSSDNSVFDQIFIHKEFRRTGSKSFVVGYDFYRGEAIENGFASIEANPSALMNIRINGVLVFIN